MGRIHLFEFEDQSWFPPRLRAFLQDHLNFMAGLSLAPFRRFTARLQGAMEASHQNHLLDLASGGGGPVLQIVRILREEHSLPASAQLTDLHPHPEALARLHMSEVQYIPEPIHALQVPEALKGFRLLCNSFHHFQAPDAIALLRDAVQKERPIAVLEGVSRTPQGFLSILVGAILLILLTPFYRPFRWDRILWTYLVPVLPLTLLWDGFVSCLRVYSPREMNALITNLGPNDYRWETGWLGAGTFLIGYKRPIAPEKNPSLPRGEIHDV